MQRLYLRNKNGIEHVLRERDHESCREREGGDTSFTLSALFIIFIFPTGFGNEGLSRLPIGSMKISILDNWRKGFLSKM